MSEPIFHYFDDGFDDSHPLAFVTLYCGDCLEMVHCENNETMQPWFETGVGNVCLDCFTKRAEKWDYPWDALEIKP